MLAFRVRTSMFKLRRTASSIEHGLPLVRDQGMRGQSAGQEPHRLLDLPQPPLGQPAFVEGVSAQQVVAQGARGPDPELGAALRVDPVADGEDGVEVEVVDVVGLPVRGSMCKFCTNCLRLQLALLEDVADVLGDHRPLPPEELGHLLLAEPDRVPVEANVHPDIPVGSLIDDDLAARGPGHQAALLACDAMLRPAFTL
jgi:hypothetical protein